MTDISCFDYLNGKHLMEFLSCRPRHKIPEEIKGKMDELCTRINDVLEKYCETYKFEIPESDKKVTWFLYEDLDLNLETIYVSGISKFNKNFLLDVIKVVAFK